MLKKILGLLGWLGVILVFIAVALRWLPLGKPEWQAWSTQFALAGLICTLLYILSQWREVARSFSGREARYGISGARQRHRRARDPRRDQLAGGAAEQAVGPDGREAVHAV